MTSYRLRYPEGYRQQLERDRAARRGPVPCPVCGLGFRSTASVGAHRSNVAACRPTADELRAADLIRKRRWRLARGMVPRGTPRAQPPAPPEPAPIPVLETHPLIDEALLRLRPYERSEIGTDMDAIGRDLVGEYVLAAVAGQDPDRAVVVARARYRRDRLTLVFGLHLVDDLAR